MIDATDDVNTPSTDGTQNSRESYSKPAPEPVESIDSILGVCATYATPVLGTKDQAPFMAGFKQSKTYQEAHAALSRLLVQAKLEELEPFVDLKPFGHELSGVKERIAALQSQLEGAAGVLASDKQGVRTEVKRNGGEPSA